MSEAEATLEVYRLSAAADSGPGMDPVDGEPVFSSTGRWLHPLFELEEFLQREALDPGRLLLSDKVVGRAAALLIVRLGFRRLRAGVLSRPGRQVLEAHGLRYTCDRLVERILCRTEDLLAGVEDLEQAYALLRERAGR